MTAVGTRRIVWSGGEHDFCAAKIGTILALEQASGCGIAEILHRLEAGTWRLSDVRESIRLGLIGAGMAAKDAQKLVEIHVDQNPHGLAPSVLLAYEIVKAVLVGVPDDPVGKEEAAEDTDHPSFMTTDAFAARPFMDSVPVSSGCQETSTTSPSGSFPPPLMDITAPTAESIIPSR